jgi:Fe-S cluster biogenesis protein NfuA
LHDLHPLDVPARIERALDRVRPYLGSHAGGVEFLGVDEEGVARLRLEGSCEGCASSTETVRMAIEGAVRDAAPELTGIEVAGVVAQEQQQPLLQVGMGPPPDWRAVEPAPEPRGNWVGLPEIGPPTGRPETVELAGMRVLLCSVRGTLYAYRDVCAGCGSSLAGGELNGNLLACPSCGTRFNVRLAGRGIDTAHHLDPLPLLSDSGGTRVAVPPVVAS